MHGTREVLLVYLFVGFEAFDGINGDDGYQVHTLAKTFPCPTVTTPSTFFVSDAYTEALVLAGATSGCGGYFAARDGGNRSSFIQPMIYLFHCALVVYSFQPLLRSTSSV